MIPVIAEILRWRTGDPVRSEVQKRWQQELRKVNEWCVELEHKVAELTDQLAAATKRATEAEATRPRIKA